MLRDTGLQYSFLSYADVIQRGVPEEYRVLILPACLCLSDAEARAIRAFCERGGTVIADYLPGLWDRSELLVLSDTSDTSDMSEFHAPAKSRRI
jgi:hypothetical protein